MTESIQMPPNQPPPWFAIALRESGVREIAGPGMNPRIQAYYTATDLGRVTDDAIPWCSAFANWCMREAGVRGTGKANARSWLSWGIPMIEPKIGCVCVFSRPPNPASGHVAFYAGEVARKGLPSDILVLGGNQGDQVRAAPYARARLLGYRWPGPAELVPKTPLPIGVGAPPPLKPKK